jgi:SAM-dependent methyltransferase
MGPLYHLLKEEDRRRAAAEARRVLRPGGLLLASFISRYAPLRDVAKFEPDWIVEHQADAEAVLARGVLVAPTGFTDAYFAHPTEVLPFMKECGYEALDLVACEGVISMIEEKVNGLTGAAWEAWVDLNHRLGKDPSVHGGAEHLLYVGRRT